MTGKEALKRLEKQYKRQNEYIKENYDRIGVTLPKGTKEKILQYGEKPNTLINRLVLEWLLNQDTSQDPVETGFTLPDGIDNIDSPFM